MTRLPFALVFLLGFTLGSVLGQICTQNSQCLSGNCLLGSCSTFLTLDQARAKHPNCFADSLFDSVSTPQGVKKYLDVNALAHWENKPEDSRYDYTCWGARAQFNCEYAPGTAPAVEAKDWKINLWRTSDKVCNVNKLINDIGGPLALAQLMKQQIPNQSGPYTFVVLGESVAARIMESFTCGWQEYTTDTHTNFFPYPLTEARKNNYLIKTAEAGTSAYGMDITNTGCRGNTQIPKWFWPGVPVPPYEVGCDMNIAMIELSNIIRFAFINRLEDFENPDEILFTKMGIDPADVTAYVASYDYELEDMLANKIQAQPSNDVLSRSLEIDYPFFADLQQQQLGYYYGALNAGFTMPDVHPCVPGLPDDVANLILYSLIFDVGLKNGGYGPWALPAIQLPPRTPTPPAGPAPSRVPSPLVPPVAPTRHPTKRPTKAPTKKPTRRPTGRPTNAPGACLGGGLACTSGANCCSGVCQGRATKKCTTPPVPATRTPTKAPVVTTRSPTKAPVKTTRAPTKAPTSCLAPTQTCTTGSACCSKTCGLFTRKCN